LADLPWQGQIAVVRLQVRRFRCATAACPRQILTKCLAEATVSWARKALRRFAFRHALILLFQV
jgi:hypothetical protein